MAPRVPNAEQTRRTRRALLAAARALFAEHGFAATSTEQIVAAAGVTRGALYHQFRDKSDLFEAVVEALEEEIVAELAAAVAGLTEPADMLRRAAAVFLELCRRPDVRRIALVEAPAVLGWLRWREIDARHGLGLLRGLLAHAAEQGRIEAEAVDALAHLFLGAVSESALAIAHADDPEATGRRLRESLEWMIDKMLGAPARA